MNHLTQRLRSPTAPTVDTPARAVVSAADCDQLLIRLTFGLLMAGHGAQKLFGRFGGDGLTATGKGFAAPGYRPGRCTPPWAAARNSWAGSASLWGCSRSWRRLRLIGVMINAMATVSGAHGLWDTQGGVE